MIADEEQEKASKDPMVSVTFRMKKSFRDELDRMAGTLGWPIARVMRVLIEDRLIPAVEAMDNVKYVDPVQAAERNRLIAEQNKAVAAAGNAMADIANQLRRIGINYNQEIRLRHIQAKMNSNSMRTDEEVATFDRLAAQKRAILRGEGVLSSEELDSLMSRLEAVQQRMVEALCRMRE